MKHPVDRMRERGGGGRGESAPDIPRDWKLWGSDEPTKKLRNGGGRKNFRRFWGKIVFYMRKVVKSTICY